MKKLTSLLALILSAVIVLVSCGANATPPVVVDAGGEVVLNDDFVNKTASEAASKNYVSVLDLVDIENFNVNYDVTLEVYDGFGTFLEGLAGQPGISSTLEMIGLNSVSTNFDIARNKDLFKIGADVLVNSGSVVDAEVVLNSEDFMGYVSVPKLVSKAIGFDFSEFVEGFDTESVSEFLSVYFDYVTAVEEVAAKYDEERIAALITPYLDATVEALGEDCVVESETVDFGAFSKNYDIVTYSVGEEELGKVVKAILVQLRDDKNLMPVLEDLGVIYDATKSYYSALDMDYMLDEEYDAEAAYELIMEAVDEGLAYFDEVEYYESEEKIDISLFLEDDELRGASVGVADFYEFFSVLFAEDGNDIYGSLDIADTVNLSLVAENNNGAYTGVIEVAPYYSDETFEIYFEDFFVSEDGQKSGGAVAVYGDSLYAVTDGEIPENVGFRFIINQTDALNASIALELLDVKDAVAKLAIDMSIENGNADITVPASYVDVESDEEMEELAYELLSNLPALVDSLKAAGINDQILDLLMSQLPA